jgi:hypothetical protein
MSKPKYEVGKTYKDKRGVSVTLTQNSYLFSDYIFTGTNENGVSFSYTSKGKLYLDQDSEYDLLPLSDQPKPKKSLTQCEAIALHIAKKKKITGAEAYRLCGTLKLPQRIKDIEKKYNITFERIPKKHKLEYNGNKGRHFMYCLNGALSEQSEEFQSLIKQIKA